MTEPYREAAWAYWAAGWRGVLPLPAGRKTPPPAGYTGWAGVEPSGADIQTWVDGAQGAGNIALHLPPGLYGLDVDDYDGKTGAAALERLVERLGPLPATWIVSSREASASGIRLFRADPMPGRMWVDEPAGHGVGIEAIHRGHRYAVVWPSVHPETGRKYVWRRPDGMPADEGEVPRVDTLPALPAAWVAGLSREGEIRTGEIAGHDETVERVGAWRDGEPCPRVRAAYERAMGGLSAAVAGAALHPAAATALHELTNLGHEGHAGVKAALAEHYSAHVEARAGRGEDRGKAEGEWWRMVRGAVGKLPAGSRREVCDCDAYSGAGLEFDPYVGPDALPSPASDYLTPEQAGAAGMIAGGEVDAAGALIAELLTADQVAALPNPVPVVAGLLYMDTLSWLIGKSGAFKSFVALDLAAHVAGGLAWAGRRTITGTVLYLAAEGGGGMGLRVRAWVSVRESMTGPLWFLRRPVQARDAAGWAALVEATRRLRPVLIVLDTQARITVGVKENDNAEMGQFIEQADRLRRAAGSCVLIVHHIGRQGDDARGASAIDGAQDTELKVERIGGPKALRARLVVDKQKDGPDTEQIEFELRPVELGRDPETGLSVTSLVAVASEFVDPFPAPAWRDGLNENQGLIIDILRDQFSEQGGTRGEVAAVLRERGQRGGQKFVRTTFYDAWNALAKKDRIAQIRGTQRFVIVDEDDQ